MAAGSRRVVMEGLEHLDKETLEETAIDRLNIPAEAAVAPAVLERTGHPLMAVPGEREPPPPFQVPQLRMPEVVAEVATRIEPQRVAEVLVAGEPAAMGRMVQTEQRIPVVAVGVAGIRQDQDTATAVTADPVLSSSGTRYHDPQEQK